jgi:hypothetical protein
MGQFLTIFGQKFLGVTTLFLTRTCEWTNFLAKRPLSDHFLKRFCPQESQ